MHLIKIYKLIRIFLLPFVPLYILIFYLKKIIGKPLRYEIPVICIGNITTGGTGKTPAVIRIAKLLKEMGYSPGVASRGYRGSASAKGAIVSDGNKILLTPGEAGDEPFMIARELENIPVAISSHRQYAVNKLIDLFNIDIVLMDDGFQNNSIYKNINIINFDATNPFGNGFLLPAGDLREFACSLKQADMIFINKANFIQEKDYISLKSKLKKYSGNKPVYKVHYKNESLFRVNNIKKELPAGFISGKNTLIISSVANPDSVAFSVKNLKPSGIKQLVYPDHYFYNEKDIKNILCQSENFDIVILTDKDYVKMTGYLFPDKFVVLKLSLMIENNSFFIEHLKECLKQFN